LREDLAATLIEGKPPQLPLEMLNKKQKLDKSGAFAPHWWALKAVFATAFPVSDILEEHIMRFTWCFS
jgi:hypothetical protein